VRPVLQVVSERRRHRVVEREIRDFITSLSRGKADAARLLTIIRGHWGVIENGLYWVRDVVFHENRSTIASGHAPQNFAALRNAAIDCLRADTTDNLAATLHGHYRKPDVSSPNSASCKRRSPWPYRVLGMEFLPSNLDGCASRSTTRQHEKHPHIFSRVGKTSLPLPSALNSSTPRFDRRAELFRTDGDREGRRIAEGNGGHTDRVG